MNDLGKVLVGLGSILVVAGLIVMLSGKMNLPWGRLPGDVSYRGKNTIVYFPLASSIIVSIILSVLFWLFNRHGR